MESIGIFTGEQRLRHYTPGENPICCHEYAASEFGITGGQTKWHHPQVYRLSGRNSCMTVGSGGCNLPGGFLCY